MTMLSRRGFNKGLAASILAMYGTAYLPRHVWAEAAAALGYPSVAVVSGTNADVAETYLRTALEGLGGMGRFVKAGQSVAIKVNVTWPAPPNTASNTDPELLRAMIKLVREAGASRVIITDHVIGADAVASETVPLSGIGKVLDETKVERAIFSGFDELEARYATITAPKSKVIEDGTFGVIKAASQADVRINMAVAKSHSVLPVTMTLKHMMGLMYNPGYLHGVGLDQGIADINSAEGIHCSLHVLEAIRVRLTGNANGRGNESNPEPGKLVKRFNQLLVGTDPVLIDSYGANVLFKGYKADARGILHILRSYQMGLGEIDVDTAMADGRMQAFQAGQQVVPPTATPTVTPTAAPIATGQPTATMPAAATPTATPPKAAPTQPPAPTFAAEPAGGVSGGASGTSDAVLNYVPAVSGALVPVVAIVAALGMVVRRRLEARERTG
jgi:uncharacterized protein (DUF362 family)